MDHRTLPYGLLSCLVLTLSTHTGCSSVVDLQDCALDSDCGSGDDSIDWECREGICVGPEPQVRFLRGSCQELLAPEGVEEEAIFWIGVMVPLQGDRGEYGQRLLDAMVLAQEELNFAGGSRGRLLGLVSCDSSQTSRLEEAASFLVEEANITALVGSVEDSEVVSIAQDITVPGGALLVAPTSRAREVAALEDAGLVWQVEPGSQFELQALARSAAWTIESELTEDGAVPRLILLTPESEATSGGKRDVFWEALPGGLRDESRWEQYSYPFLDEAPPVELYAEIFDGSQEPALVVLLGGVESVSILEGIEDRLQERRTRYLVTDEARQNRRALERLGSRDMDERLLGVLSSPRQLDWVPYQEFSERFRRRHGANANLFSSVSQAYDALYLIALAAQAEGFRGEDLARGMTRISVPGAAPFSPPPGRSALAFERLASGAELDYMGASGPLYFDEQGAPSLAPIGWWCLRESRAQIMDGLLLELDGTFSPRTCGR